MVRQSSKKNMSVPTPSSPGKAKKARNSTPPPAAEIPEQAPEGPEQAPAREKKRQGKKEERKQYTVSEEQEDDVLE
ncbi:hypothetical protein SNE40_021755 [Patella caerulea]|uniref:Uncharacterized protein n=1 Tax=Patella caerulea TaxID=87958 RepID=A0AAN8GCX2_PATCE